MRQLIKDFAEVVSETLPIVEPVYEFGSLQVDGQVGFANLRRFFPGKKYVGCDMREGCGVDAELDLHDIDLPPESVGTVLVFDTLEHVEYPRKAMEEIRRILKPDGIAVITSVMQFPIHDYPYDFWRFTPEGFESLLRPFVNVFVGFAGDELFPHTVVGVGAKDRSISFDRFAKEYEEWRVRLSSNPGKPFVQGLPREVVYRLLNGTWTRDDYGLYLKTDHWKEVRDERKNMSGWRCVLCDKRNPQVYHRPGGYKHFFAEKPGRHLIAICLDCLNRNSDKLVVPEDGKNDELKKLEASYAMLGVFDPGF